jgi:hypothetical protein
LFLFGEGSETGAVLAQSLRQHGVLESAAGAVVGLSGAGRRAVGREIVNVVSGLLDVDLGEVVVGAWAKHARLTAAAKRTAAAPGSEEIVELAAHRVTSMHRPYIEVLVDDRRVATLHLEFTIELVVGALAAVVRRGDLVALHAGQCAATAQLHIEGHEVIVRRGQLNLRAVLPVDDGISLLPRRNRG